MKNYTQILFSSVVPGSLDLSVVSVSLVLSVVPHCTRFKCSFLAVAIVVVLSVVLLPIPKLVLVLIQSLSAQIRRVLKTYSTATGWRTALMEGETYSRICVLGSL